MFWNVAVRRYFEANPYVAVDKQGDAGEDPVTDDDEPPLPPSAPLADGVAGDAGALSGAADGAASGGADHTGDACDTSDGDGRGRGRTAIDADLASKPDARNHLGADNVSAKEVLLRGRRRGAPKTLGGAAGAPPHKKQKPNRDEASVLRPLECDPLHPLVGRAILGPKVTGAPPKHPLGAPDPPTPARGCRVALPTDKFVLRDAVKEGRTYTIGQLLQHWATQPSTLPGDGINVRVVLARQFATVVRNQDKVPLLLPRGVLMQAGEKRHAIYTAGQKKCARPMLDRAIVEVVIKEATHLLPYDAMASMAELHRINADYATAGQSSLWLERLGKDKSGGLLLDPESNPFLMPIRMSADSTLSAVKGAVGGAILSHVLWQRSVPRVVNPTTIEVVDLQSAWALDARTFIDAARPVWLKWSFVDPFLVELGHWAAATRSGMYVMT
eukprot:TRINITY_DN3536_c0_g1_i2.p2 TRINITY_DN3536_c0_g1~~TRINITY_DN3536_c0_g1_i2.p2  ORF type:complete len:443 (-),score=82.23 TRINITY_DN3536_c0_g1_i2:656-1984(-)